MRELGHKMSRQFYIQVIKGKGFDINAFRTREELNYYSEEIKRFGDNPEKFFEELDPEIPLILRIQLIPKSTWGVNVRSKVKKSDWDKIRKAVYEKANMECHICEEKYESLDAHEVWEFDEENHIQKLVEIIGICKACHNTIHYGRANMIGTQKEARDHFLKVNECDMVDWQNEVLQARVDGLRRNEITDWKLDLSLIEEQGYEIIE